jgi:hypothetical protein
MQGKRERTIHCISGRLQFLADMFSITMGEYCAVRSKAHQRTRTAKSGGSGKAQAHVDVDDVFVPVVVHLSNQSGGERCAIIKKLTTHVFRERRVAAAEHENARRLVREGGAKEVRDVLVTLEPVKRRLCFPSYARGDLYDPPGSRKKSALTVHISGPYYEDRLKQNRDQGSVRGARTSTP